VVLRDTGYFVVRRNKFNVSQNNPFFDAGVGLFKCNGAFPASPRTTGFISFAQITDGKLFSALAFYDTYSLVLAGTHAGLAKYTEVLVDSNRAGFFVYRQNVRRADLNTPTLFALYAQIRGEVGCVLHSYHAQVRNVMRKDTVMRKRAVQLTKLAAYAFCWV